jgi:TRAP-type C4-dicarboxylate transport system substrate-binding protein
MKILIVAAVLLLGGLQGVVAQTVIRFALPTAADHPRNQVLARWAAAVAKMSGNRLAIEFRHDETRYDGSRILNAVAEGAVDMAAPGWWLVSRFEPNFRVSALPMFYGREAADMTAIFDGRLGQALDQSLEQALRVKVLGRRIDLGFGHIYLAAKPVERYGDLVGLNIRVPGGSADLARYLVFGATPRRVAIAKLFDALTRKLIGGLLTTHVFASDAELWRAGVKFAFLDNQVFYQYTPIFNLARWQALPAEAREWLSRSWEETVDEMRRAASRRQAEGRAAAARENVVFFEPDDDVLAAMRLELLKEQPALVKALGMNKAFVARVRAALAARDRAAGG